MEASHRYRPVLEYYVAIKLGISSLTEAELGNPVGAKDVKGADNRVRDIPCACWLESHWKTQLFNCTICAEGLGQSYGGSLVGGLVSVSPYGPSLFDSIDFLVMSLTLLNP